MQCELDTHANTCWLGKDCRVLYESGWADVGGFLEELGELVETRIVSVMLAYDNLETGETYLLTFHQVLHFPNMNHHLLNPSQIRMLVMWSMTYYCVISSQVRESHCTFSPQ